jgi:DNA-directed RNA polymerase subunit M/transcription elongation factor TFIIS
MAREYRKDRLNRMAKSKTSRGPCPKCGVLDAVWYETGWSDPGETTDTAICHLCGARWSEHHWKVGGVWRLAVVNLRMEV